MRSRAPRAVLGLRGVRAPLFFSFSRACLDCAEPLDLLSPTHSARYMANMRKKKCQLKYAEGSGHWVGGQEKMDVRRPQVDKKDSRKMGFSSLPLGGMGTANKSGNRPPPLPPASPGGGQGSPTMRGL